MSATAALGALNSERTRQKESQAALAVSGRFALCLPAQGLSLHEGVHLNGFNLAAAAFCACLVSAFLPSSGSAQSLREASLHGLAPSQLSLGAISARPFSLASARDGEPSSGISQIVIGYVGVGLALVNLALIPVCYADFYPAGGKDLCVGLSIGIGAVGLAVGIPLLIVGYNKRANRGAWRERRGLSYHLSNLRLGALHGGGTLTYRARL